MTRYSAITFTAEVPYRIAKAQLDALGDGDIIERLGPHHVEHLGLPDLAWRPDEPEHEELGATLRTSAEEDLGVLYKGYDDNWCKDWLAVSVEPRSGLPALIVLFDNENDNDPGDWTHHGNCNPVTRLQLLNVCGRTALTPDVIPVETVADGYSRGGMANNVFIPTTINWTAAIPTHDNLQRVCEEIRSGRIGNPNPEETRF